MDVFQDMAFISVCLSLSVTVSVFPFSSLSLKTEVFLVDLSKKKKKRKWKNCYNNKRLPDTLPKATLRHTVSCFLSKNNSAFQNSARCEEMLASDVRQNRTPKNKEKKKTDVR